MKIVYAAEIEVEIEKLVFNLEGSEALESLERDPYWPKWNSPWWQMLLLYEMGRAGDIPKKAVEKLTEVLKTHYLPVFPVHEHEMPADANPFRDIACHCAVGSAYQLLFSCGVNVDEHLPWMRPWILKYQLPDGGLNCDEKAYLKPVPKSSIVSSLPCFEAILFCRNRELTSDEKLFLDRAANYLVKQKLFRKQSDGSVIDPDWLEIRFPRFYGYDYFRGFFFLKKYSMEVGFSIPEEIEREVHDLIVTQWNDQGLVLKRHNLIDRDSYNPQADGNFQWGEVSEIDLMKQVSGPGVPCEILSRKWLEVLT